MSIELNSLPQPDTSLGGLRNFYFQDVKKVISVDRPINHVINNITLSAEWLQGVFNPKAAKYNFENKNVPAGQLFPISFECKIVGRSATIELLLSRMKSTRFLLVVEDMNSDMRLLGSKDVPCLFEWEYSSANNEDDNHGYLLKFTTEALNSPYYYYGITPCAEPSLPVDPGFCLPATILLNTLSFFTVDSGGNENIELVNQDDEEPIYNVLGNKITVTEPRDLVLELHFNATEDYVEIEIGSNIVGTFTAFTQDGSSGSISFLYDSNPETLPITTTLTNILRVNRTSFGSAGRVTLTGTYE